MKYGSGSFFVSEASHLHFSRECGIIPVIIFILTHRRRIVKPGAIARRYSLNSPYQLPAADLAYLGDAVYEIEVRTQLVKQGVRTPSVASLAYVKATAQSAAMEKILPYLRETEADVYRRGRNCIHNTTPKSCTPSEYRRATGLEALLGYLWLLGDTDRIHALLRIGIGIGEDSADDAVKVHKEV